MNKPEVFLPHDGKLVSETDAILTTNHLGALVNGDTGGDAQYFANHNHLRVIACDRPGTGNIGERTPQDFTTYHSQYLQDWITTIVPYVEPEGVERLHVFGRSSGAMHLLEVVAKDRLPVASVGAVESIGWRNMSLVSGRLRYGLYMLGTELRRSTIEGKPPAQQSGSPEREAQMQRLAEMIARQRIDIQNNQHVWRTDRSLKAANYIARRLPEVTMELTFSQRPLAAPLQYLKDVAALIVAYRVDASIGNPSAKRAYVSFAPNTTHASFDTRERQDERLKSLLEKANR